MSLIKLKYKFYVFFLFWGGIQTSSLTFLARFTLQKILLQTRDFLGKNPTPHLWGNIGNLTRKISKKPTKKAEQILRILRNCSIKKHFKECRCDSGHRHSAQILQIFHNALLQFLAGVNSIISIITKTQCINISKVL